MADHGITSHTIARAVSLTVDEVEIVLMEREIVLKNTERDYYEKDWPVVLWSIEEMKKDFTPVQQSEMRRGYLLEKIRELKKTPNDSRIPSLVREVKAFTGKSQDATPAMLIRAKEYPIDQLIRFNRSGFAPCIYHKEISPSMKLYKQTNHIHCFGCSKTADVIDVAQHLWTTSFKETITRLQ